MKYLYSVIHFKSGFKNYISLYKHSELENLKYYKKAHMIRIK